MSRKQVGGAVVLAGVLPWGVMAQPCAWEWTEFSPGSFDRTPFWLTVHDEGPGPRLFALGTFDRAGGVDGARRIARWDGAAGGGWSTLGQGLQSATVRAAAGFDDGGGPALFVGGSSASGSNVPLLSHWRNGQWSGVPGSEELYYIKTMASFDVIGGPALYIGTQGVPSPASVHRWDGSNFSVVGGSFSSSSLSTVINVLHVHDDGSGPALHAGGVFTLIDGTPGTRFLARWNGNAWESVVPFEFAIASVNGLVSFDPDGQGLRLYVCGNHLQVAGGGSTGLGYWRDGVWTRIEGVFECRSIAVSSAAGSPAVYFSGYPTYNTHGRLFRIENDAAVQIGSLNIDAHVMVEHDDGSGAGLELVMAGVFRDGGQVLFDSVAKWNGTELVGVGTEDLGTSPDREVKAMAVLPDPLTGQEHVYVSGFMSSVAGQAGHIGRWDGSEWHVTGSEFGSLSRAHSFASFRDGGYDWIYAGGYFGTLKLIRWDGTVWSDATNGLSMGPLSLLAHDDGSGLALYAGGSQSMATPTLAASALLRWTGASWSHVGGPVTGGGVDAMVVYDGGGGPELYIGGAFQQISAQPFARIARWDGTQWRQVGDGLQPGGNVYSMLVYDDGSGAQLYVFGSFNRSGTVTLSQGRGRWNGTVWSSLPTNGAPYSNLAAAVVDDGGGPVIYVGGAQHGVSLSRFDGQSWTPVHPGAVWNGAIRGLAVLHDSPGATLPALYVGGDFTIAAGAASGGFARFGCPMTSHCYANCDGSTVEPILNVDDFTCFINSFAAGQALPHEEQIGHYANCDGSTTAPVLNVDDFTCFINAFAAGCR